MSTGWEDIGVLTVLEIGKTKAATIEAREGDSNDEELDALNEYIEVLEGALDKLGVKIHDNGAVTASDATSAKPTTTEGQD